MSLRKVQMIKVEPGAEKVINQKRSPFKIIKIRGNNNYGKEHLRNQTIK